MQLVIAILAVVLGALFAFGGWRFFLILLPFWGLFMGFNVGTEATRALIGDGTFATLTSWAIGIVLALVFAIFAYVYYYAAIAILAGTVGFIIGSSLWGLIGSDDGLIAFILGIALGVAAFSGAGGYASPGDFSDGFVAAMGVSAGLSVLAAAAGALLPSRPGVLAVPASAEAHP